MKRNFRRIVFVLAAVAQGHVANAAERFASVDYLGHRIPLAREYADYDDFKDDPEKLSAHSIRLIEPIMRSALFQQ
jgi:hypothetical protein